MNVSKNKSRKKQNFSGIKLKLKHNTSKLLGHIKNSPTRGNYSSKFPF